MGKHGYLNLGTLPRRQPNTREIRSVEQRRLVVHRCSLLCADPGEGEEPDGAGLLIGDGENCAVSAGGEPSLNSGCVVRSERHEHWSNRSCNTIGEANEADGLRRSWRTRQKKQYDPDDCQTTNYGNRDS